MWVDVNFSTANYQNLKTIWSKIFIWEKYKAGEMDFVTVEI